jgi:predicted component of type VI protein secretion system
MYPVHLAEESVSRLHAEILKKGGEYYLQDHSKFGTYVENLNRTELT